ncbi:MAG: hypothetical protein V4449_01465 [Patescibacteria group bacterium]
MTILTRYKGVLIALAVIVVAFFAYSYFFPKDSAPALSAEIAPENVSVDQDLISLLLELKSIKLNDAIFADSAFKSLQDFSQELVPEPVGRNNPFAPLGAKPR